MASKNSKNQETAKNNNSKGILVTVFFVIVFICALFGVDVKNNTILQTVDSVLSGDIVETASEKAEVVKGAITPLQNLINNGNGLLLNMSNFKDISKISEALSTLNELKGMYDSLKGDAYSYYDSLVGTSDQDVSSNIKNKFSSLLSSESNFIDESINFYNYLLNNQDSLSYSDSGELVVDHSIQSTFQDLLHSRVSSQDSIKQADITYQESLNEK